MVVSSSITIIIYIKFFFHKPMVYSKNVGNGCLL